MTYEQYQNNYATVERFRFVFGMSASVYWTHFKRLGTIAALCAAHPEAKRRIDLDIKVISMGAM